jgi:uncharacterized protein (TIGR02145 family)
VAGIHDNDPNTPNKILTPIGWHIPTFYEWTNLRNFLGGQSVTTTTGGKMKSTGTSLWQSPNTAATNESGFTGLPGGFRYLLGTFSEIRTRGYWWSTSVDLSQDPWLFYLSYNNSDMFQNSFNKSCGLSVRCVKD